MQTTAKKPVAKKISYFAKTKGDGRPPMLDTRPAEVSATYYVDMVRAYYGVENDAWFAMPTRVRLVCMEACAKEVANHFRIHHDAWYDLPTEVRAHFVMKFNEERFK